jgi:mRNA interferase HicA
MKYRDLTQRLKELGWYLLRQGGNHEIWTNGAETQPVPRHSEINENLARSIIKKAERYNKGSDK